MDCWLIRHPLVKARHPGRWTLWNPADQDSEAQEDMHHEIELGPRPKREPGDEVNILGKKIEPFWPFLGGLYETALAGVRLCARGEMRAYLALHPHARLCFLVFFAGLRRCSVENEVVHCSAYNVM